MIAGNQLKVATQKIRPASQAHPAAARGAQCRITSMTGTKAIQALSACEEGGKAVHSRMPLSAAAATASPRLHLKR